MKVIGIDIAIENLAFFGIELEDFSEAALEKSHINSKEWFVLDTTPEDYKHECIYTNRKKCSHDAGWFYEDKSSNTMNYYCAAHKKIVDKDKKLTWKTLNKNYINSNDVIRSIFKKLDELLEYFRSADYIVIEKQPPKNPKMIAIMNYLYSYFVIRLWNDLESKNIKLKDIIFLDAKNKVNYCLDVLKKETMEELKKKYEKNKYQYYKKLSIATIEEEENNKELLEYFNSHKKKDDLADSRNMVKWWIRKNIQKIKPKVARERKPRAKKVKNLD